MSTAFPVIWAIAGVLGGPLLGAGRAWRTVFGRLRGIAPALLSGALVSEAAAA